ncbi:MAG TPA: GNAT family N-acetyltransferase [Actinocrinis sp.]|jgi:GNAT superfamily N-acetyltransferase
MISQPDHERLVVTPVGPAEWSAAAIAWAAAEGWNPGLRDSDAFLPQDPGGFFLGRLDGAEVSAISVVNYGDEFAFLGFYLVDPRLRGRGLGIATWRAAIGHAAEDRVARPIGLDGVIAQQENYERSGFTAAYRTLKYGGVIRPCPRPAAPETGLVVFPAREVGIDELAAYDRQCYPAERREFVHRWIAVPGHTAFAAISRDEEAIVGYGVIRPGRDAYRIGPLFADTPQAAAALYEALTADLAGSPVQIDVPEPNHAACDFAVERSLAVVFETARMYTAPVSIAAPHKVFGVTTLELG